MCLNCLQLLSIRGAGSVVGIATGYGLDGPGSNPGGGEIFPTCPDRPCCPHSLLYNGYRVFPGCKVRPGRDTDPSPLLVPWLWKGRVIPLLPLWTVRPVQSLSAYRRVQFTLFSIRCEHFTFPTQTLAVVVLKTVYYGGWGNLLCPSIVTMELNVFVCLHSFTRSTQSETGLLFNSYFLTARSRVFFKL